MSELGLPDPLVVSAFFLRRASTGSAEGRTELARVGRRTATGEARLWRDGHEPARAVATFTDLTRSRGRTVELGRAPELPPPQVCIDPRAGRPMPGVTMAERIDIRCERLPGWLVGRPSGDPSASFWMRFADGRDADTLSLPTLVDACAPAVMELGARGSATVELTVHMRARPARGWLACRVSTRHVSAGYHDEDFEIWDSAASSSRRAASSRCCRRPTRDGGAAPAHRRNGSGPLTGPATQGLSGSSAPCRSRSP
jgi:hypothetical protein